MMLGVAGGVVAVQPSPAAQVDRARPSTARMRSAGVGASWPNSASSALP